MEVQDKPSAAIMLLRQIRRFVFAARIRRNNEFDSLKNLVTSLRDELEKRATSLRDELEKRATSLVDELASSRKTIDSLIEVDLAVIQDQINSLTRGLEESHRASREKIEDIERLMRRERLTRQRACANFERQLTRPAIKNMQEEVELAVVTVSSSSASVQPLLERFYFLLQERYRGTREEIKQRLLVYRNDFRSARDRTGIVGPIVDIGCGRGELLEILLEDGFRAIGVDSNDTQLDEARLHGVPVVHTEATAYLRALESESLLAVAGIHVVEHVPFSELIALMREVGRVLKKGGVAIFETPNPRNLMVGATTFHFDPTHVRPLPPEVLHIVLETVGFDEIELRPLHPSVTLDYMLKQQNVDPHIATLLFGPQDYAAIGVMR